jgi:hypothetical protein
MATFRFKDQNGSWLEFVDWACSLSLFEFDKAKLNYHQEAARIKLPGVHVYQRVFAITVGDDSTAAYVKLRWSDSLIV